MAGRPPRSALPVTSIADDLRDLLVELYDAEVEFLVVGGYAVGYHGHPRATKDIDLFVRPTAENAERVLHALSAFGAPLAQLGVSASDFDREGRVVQFGVAPVRADLLTSIDGVTFDEAARDARAMTIDGRNVLVIGFDALIANKRASGRPQDLVDVDALLAIRSRATER